MHHDLPHDRSSEQPGQISSLDDSVALQRVLWQDMTEDALANVAAAGVTIIRPDKGLFRTRGRVRSTGR